MATKAYEVVHGFGHEGVYYTRDNQHEIADHVAPDVLATLVQQKIVREVPIVDETITLDEQHAHLRKVAPKVALPAEAKAPEVQHTPRKSGGR